MVVGGGKSMSVASKGPIDQSRGPKRTNEHSEFTPLNGSVRAKFPASEAGSY